MTDSEPAQSPLQMAAGTDGSHATGAFALLGNETRLAILLALWEAYDARSADTAVPFSQLRERVGMRDSGQFNYHLTKLEGAFVRQTDTGYALRPLGLQLVQTVIAGTGRETDWRAADFDIECYLCGAATEVAYRDGWLYHVCTECDGGFEPGNEYPRGVLFAEPFPAAALANRTPEEVFAAGVFKLLQATRSKMGGLCPQCASAVESTLELCEDHATTRDDRCPTCGNADAARIYWECPVCKYAGGAAPGTCLIVHPAVVSFYHDHGIEVEGTTTDFERSKRAVELMRRHEQEVLSTDPPRVRVTVRAGDDELSLVVDETLTPVDDVTPPLDTD